MILVTHIVIASLSLIVTGSAYLAPSRLKLRLSYAFIAMTLGSGTFLIVTQPAHLTQTCIVGLLYLGFVSLGLIASRKKLALSENA